MTVSTVEANLVSPASARRMRRGPSNANGLVTTAMVSASSSLASEAITGAAPVPVPPPKPGADEHHVGALQQFDDLVGILQGGLPPDLRVEAGALARS